MIAVTRLSGRPFLLNADLIEQLDSSPETVITMMDGKQYVVAESRQQVLDAIAAYRASVTAAATRRCAKRGTHLRAARGAHSR